MANEYTNKVVANNTTLIDLTSDTATAADVLEGRTLHLASGAPAVGSYRPGDEIEARLKATVGHSAKNLLEITADTTTAHGVTFTVNPSNGSIVATGTCTSSSTNQAQFNIQGSTRPPISDGLLSNGMVISCENLISGSRFGLVYYDVDATFISEQICDNTNSSQVVSIPSNAVYYRFYVRKTATAGGTTVTFKPMLRDGSISDDTFEPYVTPTDERIIQLRQDMTTALAAKLDKPVVLWEGTAYNTTLVTLPVTDIRNDYDRLILQFETSTSGSYPTVYFFEAIVNTDFNNTFPSHERTFPATYGSVLLSMSIQYGSANSLIFNYAELIGTVSSYNVKLTKIIGIPK